MSKKIELEIIALSHSVVQTHSYAVVLSEVNGVRKLPIVIGSSEAQAIAVVLENMQPSRPLTHDLMKNIMDTTRLILQEVLIYKISEGIFYSKLICQHENEKIEIDSRTSDALALAVRYDSPIYTYENILNYEDHSMGKQTEKKEIQTSFNLNIDSVPDFKKMSLSDLQIKLEEVLDAEDYVTAAQIRDEINSRK